MGLSMRDVVGTVLVAAAVMVTVAVASGWNWPLLADARAGAIALFVVSYPSCLVAQAPKRMAAAIQHETRWSPFVIAGTILGAVALFLILANLLFNSVALLVAATAVVVGIWLITTADHALSAGPRPIAAAG